MPGTTGSPPTPPFFALLPLNPPRADLAVEGHHLLLPLRGGVGGGEEIVLQEGDREGEGGVVGGGKEGGQEEEEGEGGRYAVYVKEVDAAI